VSSEHRRDFGLVSVGFLERSSCPSNLKPLSHRAPRHPRFDILCVFPLARSFNFIYDALYDLVQDENRAKQGQMPSGTPHIGPLDIPTLVREIRKSRHMTQEQLARELQVTFSTVNGWENGKHRPIPALARKLVELADASDIPPAHYASGRTKAAHRTRKRRG
jgi:DNA-binding transcriptional regulator YiaG